MSTKLDAIKWWDKLSIPQKYNARKLCYPEQKSVYVSEKQITEMYSLKDNNITKPVTLNKMRGYKGYHHILNNITNKSK